MEREKDMMLWLEESCLFPRVLHTLNSMMAGAICSRVGADGVLCSEEYEDEQSPEKIIELYAEHQALSLHRHIGLSLYEQLRQPFS